MKKEMLINVLQPEECRIAIVEDGILEELYVERTSLEGYTGNIYKGKIVNIEPAIQAAFVDFSVGRNGFLHVSDVEPQYYRRHLVDEAGPPARDRDRERERPSRPYRDLSEPRTPRPEDRTPRPPTLEERPRDRERERERERFERAEGDRLDWDRYDRPDRSERGRRDRSEYRRFGEGLFEDEWAPPPPSTRPVEPPRTPPPGRDEPRRVRAETPPPPPRVEEAPAADQAPLERDLEDTWSRPAPATEEAFEELERYLPPSRTQRGRGGVPPRPAKPDFEAVPEEPESTPRGRPLSSRPAPAPSWPEPEPIAGEPLESKAEVREPIAEEPELPPRRGGRAAIRARGGERERERELKDRDQPPYRDRDREWPRPEPEPTTAQPWDLQEIPEGPEPPRSGELKRPRPRGRDRDRTRSAEPEISAERPRVPPDRAGEPGYIPRRERERIRPEAAPEIDPVIFDWLEPERSRAEEPPIEEPSVEAREEDLTLAERKRRRRRRRRRRDEPLTPAEMREDLETGLDSEVDLDAEDRLDLAEPAAVDEEAFDWEEPPRRERDRDRGRRRDRDRLRPTFDEEETDEERGELIEEDVAAAVELAPEEEIDPELEEEIRREIEEIQALEREMGLRGVVEARPRRGEEFGEIAQGPKAFRGGLKPPIQEVFKRGDEVLVQVIKESIGNKGPTLSTYISIPGRYLVLMPGLNRVGVSRKIADEAQRRKLRQIMNELNPPKGLGFIVRTAGLDRSKRELARDLAYLLRLWKVILRRIKKAKSPAPIYQESDMIIRTIRDIFSGDIDTIWIDEPQAFERAQDFMRVVMPKFVDRIKLYDEKVPLFHKYGLEDEIAKIQRRRVDLPEGGSIVIDPTEALVAIDVNSGNFRVEDDAERTAYEMNLRAAKEIARQLRLRDLGGVIVNDFIDMREEKHRRGVERALREAVKRDRARTKILRMSQFGLIEMTRQRIRPSLKRSVYEDCTHCTGAGVVKTAESMAIDVMRLLALAAHRAEIRRVNLCVAPAVATYLNNRKRKEITQLEGESNLIIHIRHDENVPAEYLQIDCFDAQNAEVRLLPAPPPPSRRR